MGKIYKITNLINNKIYIGKTIYSVEERFNRHIKIATKNLDNNLVLSRSIRKYGFENFIVETIEQVNKKKDLNKREKYWIKFYNCKCPNGYNMTGGGDGCFEPTEEYRYKLSMSQLIAQNKLETKNKRKQSQLNRWANMTKDKKEKFIKSCKLAQNRPEVKERQRQIQLIAQNRPETLEKQRINNYWLTATDKEKKERNKKISNTIIFHLSNMTEEERNELTKKRNEGRKVTRERKLLTGGM